MDRFDDDINEKGTGSETSEPEPEAHSSDLQKSDKTGKSDLNASKVSEKDPTKKKKKKAAHDKSHKKSHGDSEDEEGERAESAHKANGDKDSKEKSKGGGSSGSNIEDNQPRIIQFSSGQTVNFGSLAGLLTSNVVGKVNLGFFMVLNQQTYKLSVDAAVIAPSRHDGTSTQTQVTNTDNGTTKSLETQLSRGGSEGTSYKLTSIYTKPEVIEAPSVVVRPIDFSNTTPNSFISINYTINTGIGYNPVFNVGQFFFQPQTQFVFSSVGTTGTTYNIKQYFDDAGIPVATTGYSIVINGQTYLPGNPNLPLNLSNGITYNVTTDAQGYQVATYSSQTLDENGIPGISNLLTVVLTGPDAGLMTILTPVPISLLINFQSGTSLILPIRVDAGPGTFITNNIATPDSIVTIDPTAIVDPTYGQYVVEGATPTNPTTGPSVINIVDSGTLSSKIPVIGNVGTYTGPSDNGVFTLPANVLYRHVGDSLTTIPTTSVYGNFQIGNIALTGGNTVNLGGNVLDVFGTKYGIGQELTLDNQGGAGANTIIFGQSATGTQAATPTGNTLAGFGTAFGDFETLKLNYDVAAPSPTNISFIGNTLVVDKAIDSTLYPNIQNLTITGTGAVQGITISFQNSTLQGNGAHNTFYGNIQNFGDLGNTGIYNGFITGVSVLTAGELNQAGLSSTTTAVKDANGNIIGFSNNTYTGGTAQVGSTQTPSNTYNFTLLGDQTSQPIMTGNALITNYNVASDNLVFQLTPHLYLAMRSSDKSVSVSNLQNKLTFAHTTPTTIPVVSPAWGTTVQDGTVVDFAGEGNIGGGSIVFQDLNITNFTGMNVSFQVNYSYQPMTAQVPAQTPLFGNGGTAQSNTLALDQFFTNSMFATYTTSGLPSGVTIDQYGNITITNKDAFLGDVTLTAHNNPNAMNISASQSPSTASQTLQMGFLDAPEQEVTTTGGIVIGNTASNIIHDQIGGNTIIGSLGNADGNKSLILEPGSNFTQTLGGNLIITSGSTVYGTNQSIDIEVLGDTTGQESISGKTIIFNGNAIQNSGGINTYGISDQFGVTVQGATGQNIEVTSLNQQASSLFQGNAINYGPQTLYGSGTLYGNLHTFQINVAAGQGNTIDLSQSPTPSSLDVSATVNGNTFTFKSVTETVSGDQVGDTSTLFPNFEVLDITLAPVFSKVLSANFNTTALASFTNNQFIFGDSVLKGGQGNTIFQGSTNILNDGSSISYKGFSNPISAVVDGTGHLVITSNDGFNNAISFGNNTFTGSQGQNTYSFTIFQDVNGKAVFTGLNTITNFKLGIDNLSLTLSPSFYSQPGLAGNPFAIANFMDGLSTFTQSGSNTLITFNGIAGINGSLTLNGVSLTSFTDWLMIYPASLDLSVQAPLYTAPNLDATPPAFDPVFVNLSQPKAFQNFVDSSTTNLSALIYTATGLLPGMVLSADGALSISGITVPTTTAVTVTVTDPTTGDTLQLPTQRLFVGSTSEIIQNTSNGIGSTFTGAFTTPGAYEVQAATVYGGGDQDGDGNPDPVNLAQGSTTGGSKLIYHTGTGTAKTIYGNTQDITETSSTNVDSQNYTFDANLIHVGPGVSGADQIFGNAQNLTIAPTTSGANVGNFTNNTLTFATNAIYGTGNLYGNVQLLNLDASTGTASIADNTFKFAGNTLTSGTYTPGTNILVGDTVNPTNLYTNLATLKITGNVTDNAFVFGNSTLTGIGPTNFFSEIEDMTQSLFVRTVTRTTIGANQVMVTDSSGNSITWGNDLFIGGNGPNKYTFTLMTSTPDLGATYKTIMQGNDTIQGFNPVLDTLVFNVSAPLYVSLLQGNAGNFTLTPANLNAVSGSGGTPPDATNNGFKFYFEYDAINNKTILHMNDGGSITFEGIQLQDFNGFTNLILQYSYYATPITTNGNPSQPLIFDGNHTYYSLFSPYFNNVDVFHPQSTYAITSAVPELTDPNTAGITMQTTPPANGTPILQWVNVAMNDAHFATNHPQITTFIAYFNGGTAVGSIGNPSGGVGLLFQGQGNDTLQGNAGNSLDQTTQTTTSTASQTAAHSQTVGGNNLFFDASGGATVYGAFKTIVYDYKNVANTPTTLQIQNQTDTYATNAFNVKGTTYGVAQDMSITVTGPHNLTDTNNTLIPVSASTDVSTNTYNFNDQTLFGSGTLYGDLKTLSIALQAGTNNTELGTGTFVVSTVFDHNTFTFGKNQIVVLGDGVADTTVIYPHLQELSITTGTAYAKITSVHPVVPIVTFSNNTFEFGDSTVVGGQGNMVVHTDPNFNQTDPNAYAGFTSPVLVSTDINGNLVTTTTDGLNNKIIWGENTFVSGQGTNTYEFMLLQNSAGSYDAGAAKSTYAVFTGNDTLTGFKLGTDVIKLNLDPNLYHKLSQLAGNAVLTGTLLDSIGIARFTYDGTDTKITFGGVGQDLGSLILKGVNVSNFAALDPGVAGTYFQVIAPAYVAPVFNAAAAFDPVFLNDTTQLLAFQKLIDPTTTHLSSLVYSAAGLIPGMTLSSNGTLTISGITTPQTTEVTVTVTNTATGDSITLPPQRVLVGNASEITYDTAHGAGSTFNGTLTTPGAYEVQAATVSGGGAADVDLSQQFDGASHTATSQLIYNTGTGAAKTIYGNTQNITETSHNAVDSKTYTFDANLIHTTPGIAGSDQTFGNAKNLTIAPTVSGVNVGSFTNNTLTFATNAIYGTGSLYGNFQLFKLDATAGSITISGNAFTFGKNQLIVLGDTAASTTTIYPHIQDLMIISDVSYTKITSTSQVVPTITFSNNTFTFGDSHVTGGQGNIVVHTDPNLNQTDPNAYTGFISPVLISTDTNGNLVTTTTDGLNNKIVWGNNTLVSGQGTNTYNFTLLQNSAGSYDAGTAKSTYAVFTGNDSVTGFKLGTDVIKLNLEPNVYNQLVQLSLSLDPGAGNVLTASLLDSLGVATFTHVGGDTIITFGGTATPLGSLTIKDLTLTNFAELGTDLIINKITLTNYVAPIVNPAMMFDPIFINNTTQSRAFQSLLDPSTSNLPSLVYTAVGLLPGMTLSANGTLSIANITSPQTAEVTVTVTNPVTGDSVVLPIQRIFVGNSDTIAYDTATGAGSTFNGTLTTPGAYEVQAATVSGGGAADVDLSQGSVHASSQLIYNTGTGTAKVIYGNTQNIVENTGTAVTGQTHTFEGNLIHTTPGIAGSDQTFGNAQNLTIAPSVSGTDVGSFTNNSLTFSTNAIYGTGTLYGNLELLKVDITADTAVLVKNNAFTFAGNHLTSGTYTSGTNTLVGDTVNPTNLYASIKTLDFDFDCTQSIATIQTQFTGNSFTFGDSTLTGIGSTNFYGDVADLSQSSFVLAVTSTHTNGHIEVTDPYGNSITFGNDTFISNGQGGNSYTFTFMTSTPDSGTTYQSIMQGFDTIQGFNPASDTLVLNIASPLYNKLVNGNNGSPALTVTELNSVSSDTDSTAMFYFEYTNGNTILHLDGGGSITFDGQHLTSFSDFNHLTLQYNYFDPPITVSTPTQPFIIDGTQSYYSLFSPYFDNVDIMNPNTTYTITIDGVKTTGVSLWDKPPVLEGEGPKVIEVSMNDVHVPGNTPSFTAVVEYVDAQDANQTTETVTTTPNDQIIFSPEGGSSEVSLTDQTVAKSSDLVSTETNTHTIPSDNPSHEVQEGILTPKAEGEYSTTHSGSKPVIRVVADLSDPEESRIGDQFAQQDPTENFSPQTIVQKQEEILERAQESPDLDHTRERNIGPTHHTDPDSGALSFYDDVTVKMDTNDAGDRIITLVDTNMPASIEDPILTHSFSIVETPGNHPQAILHGTVVIENFDISVDKINFALPLSLYESLDRHSYPGYTAEHLFLRKDVNVIQTHDSAFLDFAGGGSIELKGYGTSSEYTSKSLKAALVDHHSLTIDILDPSQNTSAASESIASTTTTPSPSLNSWASLINDGEYHQESPKMSPEHIVRSFEGHTGIRPENSPSNSNHNSGLGSVAASVSMMGAMVMAADAMEQSFNKPTTNIETNSETLSQENPLRNPTIDHRETDQQMVHDTIHRLQEFTEKLKPLIGDSSIESHDVHREYSTIEDAQYFKDPLIHPISTVTAHIDQSEKTTGEEQPEAHSSDLWVTGGIHKGYNQTHLDGASPSHPGDVREHSYEPVGSESKEKITKSEALGTSSTIESSSMDTHHSMTIKGRSEESSSHQKEPFVPPESDWDHETTMKVFEHKWGHIPEIRNLVEGKRFIDMDKFVEEAKAKHPYPQSEPHDPKETHDNALKKILYGPSDPMEVLDYHLQQHIAENGHQDTRTQGQDSVEALNPIKNLIITH